METYFILYIIFSLLIILCASLAIYRFILVYNYRKSLLKGTGYFKYIPKKIHQTVADKNNINPAFLKNIEYIKKMNPTWDYYLYDDKDIIDYLSKNYSPNILTYYNKINPKYGAAKADFFRYLLMYKEGGVYLDIKSGMKYPLDKIILPDDEYILSHWSCNPQFIEVNNIFGEYQQWHIISRPQHPFLEAVINKVIENIKTYDISVGVGKDAVLKVTGPIAYTKAIMPIINKHKHRLIDTDEFIGLEYNNISNSHVNLFSKTHYSKITEPVIL
jgi:mannosyltransferase OCH1-like enzyme